MDVGAFIEEYFIKPIVMHEGYNSINTLTYAIIAVASAYIIYKLFTRAGVKFDREFIIRTIPYVLLGSTARVVTDSIDTGAMQAYDGMLKPIYLAILNSHVYDYGILTTSPGIYVVIGLFAIASMYYSYRSKNYDFGPKAAFALFLLHLFILIPLMKNVLFALIILAIASAITYVYSLIIKKNPVALHWLVVFAQALDGAATFVTLDVFNKMSGGGYVEQHVFANALAGTFGGSMLPFLFIKVVLAAAIVHILGDERDANERNFIALIIIILGMAPGVRDMLRLTCGV